MSLVIQAFSGSFIAQILGSQGLVAAGIQPGDQFSGVFSYDSSASPISITSTSKTYPVISFTLSLPNGMAMAANNLSIQVSTDPQDPSIEVLGTLPYHGAFMGILLRGPGGTTGPVTSTNLPVSMDVTKFLHKDLTVCDVMTPLFSFSRNPLPPGGATIFLRGTLSSIQPQGFLAMLLALLSRKLRFFRL